MENKFKSLDLSIKRDEVSLDDIIFYPIKNRTPENARRLKSGTAVSATYNVFTEITTKRNVSNQQMREIGNAIKAFFILKGEEAIDEKNWLDLLGRK